MKAALVLGSILALGSPAVAQTERFPTKPITVIIPSSPGGTTEVQARLLGEYFREKHGHGFTVETRPGAMGAIGATAVGRAPPDGYTLLASPNSPIIFNPLTHRHLTYEPEKFTPVQLVNTQPLVLAARGNFPGETMSDLVEYARRNPDAIYYSSQGIGGGNHMSTLLLEKYTGTRMRHVPFPGAAPATQALLKGEVDFFIAPFAEILPWYRDKKAKMFAIGTRQRHPDAPDVPTFRELGYPDEFVLTAFSVLMAPPETPARVADWLNETTTELLHRPVIREKFKVFGVDPGGVSRGELTAFLERERRVWTKVAIENNIEKQ